MSARDILARVAGDLAALDLSAENTQIVLIDAQIADLEAARQKASARREQISRELSGFQAPAGFRHLAFGDAAGSAVADALLGGSDASDAAAAQVDVDGLRRESEALRQGAMDLARRIDAAEKERREIQAAAQTKLHPIVAPFIEDQIAQAIDAAKVIEASFASLSAVVFAAGVGSSEAARAKAALLQGVMNPHGLGLILVSREVVVPDDVQAALASVRDLGPACAGHAVTVVHVI